MSNNGRKIGFVYAGEFYPCETPEEIQDIRETYPEVWEKARTRNADVIKALFADYLRELDFQEFVGSTGSYGKMAEVSYRVQKAIESGAKVYIHDIRCRPQRIPDIITKEGREEYKTGFTATWVYHVASYEEGIRKLENKRDIVYRWDAFKDGREWVAPLGEILDALAGYNPKKGLTTWFRFKSGNLDMQSVLNSQKKVAFMQAVFERLDE